MLCATDVAARGLDVKDVSLKKQTNKQTYIYNN